MKLLKKGTHVLPAPFLCPSQALISVRNVQSHGPYEMVPHILCQPQRQGETEEGAGTLRRVCADPAPLNGAGWEGAWDTKRPHPAHYPPL